MASTNPEPPPEWMLPEFDPSVVKVFELRSILLQNGIPHSYTKKSDLIQLFERELRPLTPKLLRAHRNVRPSSRGIIDMRSIQAQEYQDPQPKKSPRKKASSINLTDQESVTSTRTQPKQSKKSLLRKTESEDLGTDADAETTPNSRASTQTIETKKASKKPSAANPTPSSASKRSKKRKIEIAEEEEETLQLARDELDLLDPSNQMNTKETIEVARQADSSRNQTDLPVPVKRRKSDFPIQASTIQTPPDEMSVKKKKAKPKNRRTTLHEVIEAGEGNYSDYNPFQSGPDTPGSSGKKPKPSKPKSAAPPPSNATSQPPRSATTSNIPRLASPGKQERINTRVSMHHMPQGPPDLSNGPPIQQHLSFLPKSATTSNVRASYTPQQLHGRKSVPLSSLARPTERFFEPSPNADTPEQIVRQLAPGRKSQRFEPRPPSASYSELDKTMEDDYGNGSDDRHTHFEDQAYRMKTISRRQSQLPPRSPYPIKPSLPSNTATTTPARQQFPRIRLDELVHTPSEKKLKINRQARQKPSSGLLLNPGEGLSFLLKLSCVAAILAILNWYRSQTISLGYCDTGSDSNARTRDQRIERFLEADDMGSGGIGTGDSMKERFGQVMEAINMIGLLPDCMSCPIHGICEKGKIKGCEMDYVLKNSRLGERFEGWLPMLMPPSCLPDTDKLIKIAESANGINQVLRSRRGEVVCGLGMGGVDIKPEGKSKEVKRFGITEDELKQKVMKERGVEEEIFKLALKDLIKFDEVMSLDGWLASKNFKSMEMGLKCRMKLGMYKLIKRFKLILLSLMSIGIGWIYLKVKLVRISEEKEKVKELVEITLTKLREESWVHHTNPSLKPNAYIASAHLRDSILSYEHSPIQRQKLWIKVEKIIEGNSNVRTKVTESRGESFKVWEWIGSYTSDLNLNSSPVGKYSYQTPGRNERPIHHRLSTVNVKEENEMMDA
ncbi:Man1-Src1p-C-terminal domain-containing protein [Melampsora americana]|nr:Man1-Src1p-C-terminal domain-containing protein [Melampsora americana]